MSDTLKIQGRTTPSVKLNTPSTIDTLVKGAKNPKAQGVSSGSRLPTAAPASPTKTAASLAEQTATNSNPAGSRELTNRQSKVAGALTNGLGMASFADIDPEDKPQTAPSEAGDAQGTEATDQSAATQKIDPEDLRPKESHLTTADGSQIDRKNYTKDGVSYNEKVTTRPDGTATIEVEARKDGLTETTTSNTTAVDGQITDYVPDEHDHLVGDGMEGPVQQTVTTTKVVDTSQNPPVEKITTDTTYSTVVEPSPHSEPTIPIGSTNLKDPLSKKTVSYTESVTDGQKTVRVESEINLTATDSDSGEDASTTLSRSTVFNPDGTSKDVVVEEGYTSKDFAQSSMEGDDYDQRIEQMPGTYVPYRYTSVSEGDGAWSDVHEYGNYDSPRSDGGTVSLTTSKDGLDTQNYRLVSEGGQRVQEQATVPGTEFSQFTDTNYGADGDDQTFVRSIETKDGDKVLNSSQQERKVAYPSGADIPAAAPPGMDQKQWDEFRAQHKDGPVYSDEFDSSTLVPGETNTVNFPKYGPQQISSPEYYSRTEVKGYAWGDASIGSVTQSGKGESTTTQAMLVGGGSPAASFVVDGQRAEIDGKGQVNVNGVLAGTVNASQALTSIPAAYTALMDEIHSAASGPPSTTDWARVNSNFSKGLGAAGVLGGVIGMMTAESAADVVGGAGTTVSGVGGMVEGFGTSNIVKNVGKSLGIGGSAFSLASGVMEMFSEDGNLAKGIADTVSGAAGMTAGVLALCGVTGPVGWMVGGLALGASLVSWGIDIFSDPDQADLRF